METNQKTPDSSIMQEFLQTIKTCQYDLPEGLPSETIGRLEREAHEDWIKHYNHADLTPSQAHELAAIYVSLFFAQERYLKLNKEWIKYK